MGPYGKIYSHKINKALTGFYVNIRSSDLKRMFFFFPRSSRILFNEYLSSYHMKFIKIENVEETNTRTRHSFLRRISKREGRVTSIQIPLKQHRWHRLSVKNSREFKEDGKGGLQVWPSRSLHDSISLWF